MPALASQPLARRIRVLLAKLGLDTHTIGVTVIAHALREPGMEVIFSGPQADAGDGRGTAIQEDVDVVGIASSRPRTCAICRSVVELLRERVPATSCVIAGGVIPEEDAARCGGRRQRDLHDGRADRATSSTTYASGGPGTSDA